MTTLIQNGRVVTSERTFSADVRMENGTITAIGTQLPTDGCTLYDATGCLLFAGFIDAHTHLDMNNGVTVTADDFASGTAAAICGGTTTLLDFATQDRGGTLKHALESWHKNADGKSSCDYGFHMAITDWNAAVSDEVSEMADAGVTSFKLYMAYDNLRVRDGEIYEILKRVGAVHGIIGTHCENGDLVDKRIAELRAAGNFSTHFHPLSRPDNVEAEAIARYCYIAGEAGEPVNIVHLSTKAGLIEALRARARGQRVYIETCPHYLTLDESCYDLDGFESAKFVCSPPMRGLDDQQALWEAIARGQIDTISTDHCSFNFKGQKELGRHDFSKIPNGMPGLEHRPVMIYTYGVAMGRMTENQMAALLSENTARLFGMYPKKGVLAVGSDADVVVWNPSARWTITAQNQHHNCDYTPYEGFAARGKAKAVFLHGELAVTDGELVKKGLGRYVARGSSEYF